MNEKMIFLEYEKQSLAGKQLSEMTTNKVQDLKTQLDKCQDNNIRRILDLQKLRKSLNRLKNDLYVFKLSKKLQKENGTAQKEKQTPDISVNDEDEILQAADTSQNISKDSGGKIDSDKMVSEQIQQTMEAISKMEASLTTELITQESKDRSKARRSAGNSPVLVRSRSQIVDQIRVDH